MPRMNRAISSSSSDGWLRLSAEIHSWEITALGTLAGRPIIMLGLSEAVIALEPDVTAEEGDM